MLASPKTTVKVLDMNQEEVLDSVEPAAIGTVLSDSGTVVVSSTCDGSKSIQLKLDGVVDDLKKWMLANHPPKPFETQVRFNDPIIFNSMHDFNSYHNLYFNTEKISHPDSTNFNKDLHVISF